MKSQPNEIGISHRVTIRRANLLKNQPGRSIFHAELPQNQEKTCDEG